MATLLYDADCAFCTASAERARTWGLRASIDPLQRADLAALGVDPERARRQIPFVADEWQRPRVSYGHEAIARALLTGRGWQRLLGRLMLTPPLSWPASGVYTLVARNRHSLPGGRAECRLDDR